MVLRDKSVRIDGKLRESKVAGNLDIRYPLATWYSHVHTFLGEKDAD